MKRVYSCTGYTRHMSKHNHIRSPTIAARCHHVPDNARDPSDEMWNYVGDK